MSVEKSDPKIPVYLIDPDNQIVRPGTCLPTMEDACSMIGTDAVIVLPLMRGNSLLVSRVGNYEEGGYTFSKSDNPSIYTGLGMVVKKAGDSIEEPDMTLEEVRSSISFWIFNGPDITPTEIEQQRGVA